MKLTAKTSDGEEAAANDRKPRILRFGVLGAVCALVIGLYAWSAKSGRAEWGSFKAENSYYNQLVQGFRAGQFNLKREVPPELAHLLDMGHPVAKNTHWLMDRQLLDLSYYRGKLYLYFGVTPALVLFWPYVAISGHDILYEDAVVIFLSIGFLVCAGLLWTMWRCYYAQVSTGVLAAAVLAVGLVNFTLAILQRCDVYEVAISCGGMLAMLALLAIWKAMHAMRGRVWWLAGASLAYGLALGARPSLLLGAIILLVPVFHCAGCRKHADTTAAPGSVPSLSRALCPPSLPGMLAAATLPVFLMGSGVMLYNFLRFDHPLEFGQRYQLPLSWHEQFSLRFLWSNFQICFLEPARWSSHFPLVHDIKLPVLPAGRGEVFEAFGVMANIPVVLLALAAPLAWCGRLGKERSVLKWWVAAVVIFFGTTTTTLCLHDSMWLRYQLEFAGPLILLAALGILGLERTLAGQSARRLVARWGWGLLLAFSVTFNLFAMVEQSSEAYVYRGIASFHKGQLDEAIVQYQRALELQPDNAEAHTSLGLALLEQGKVWEALSHLEESLRLEPEHAEAHNNLGNALFQLGKMPEALGHFEEAVRLKPQYAEAHNNLAGALVQLGRVPEALGRYENVLRLRPDYANAHHDLGVALFRLGRMAEALGHYEQALQLKPDYAQAHNDLGLALFQLGRVPEALGHFEEALRLQPHSAEMQNNLGIALLRLDRVAEAVDHLEQAMRLQPDFVSARNNLAAALFQRGEESVAQGKLDEAVPQYRRAIELKPDYAHAYDGLGLTLSRQGKFAEALVQYRKALELDPQLVSALNHLAWELATATDGAIRNVGEAVRLAERACQATTNQVAICLDTLGVAYSEAGRFSEAIVTARQARERAMATGQKELAAQVESRLKLYESGRPYREGAASKP